MEIMEVLIDLMCLKSGCCAQYQATVCISGPFCVKLEGYLRPISTAGVILQDGLSTC